jgi:hypothetical protein
METAMNDEDEIKRQRSELCAKWMIGFGDVYRCEVTTEQIELYALFLCDLTPQQLEFAFFQAGRSCTRFPTPADVLRCVEKNLDEITSQDGDAAWLTFRKIFERYWHPDIGISPDAPQLDPAARYAVEMIGGFHRFGTTERKNENFIKREFIEAYKRYRTTARLGPSRAEAAALLEQLKPKQLPEGHDGPQDQERNAS